jgi:hypothetical protein
MTTPLQGALLDAEILLDLGQGDVHDRDVEHGTTMNCAAQARRRTIPLAGVCLGRHDELPSDLDGGCASFDVRTGAPR